MHPNKKVNKVLESGGWKSKSFLFDPENNKDNFKVVALTSKGKVVEGTWHYSENHLEVPDNTIVVAWKPFDKYVPPKNFFQKLFGKKSD
jgi:hypothetical protein